MFICIRPNDPLKVLTVLKIKSQYSWTMNVVLMRYYFDILVSEGVSPVSSVFNKRKRPAASRILLNSIQNACTSINKSCTLIILLRIKDWRKTHTRRTKRFWGKKNKLVYPFSWQVCIKFTKISVTYLHIFILNLFTSRDAIWYIKVNKFRR